MEQHSLSFRGALSIFPFCLRQALFLLYMLLLGWIDKWFQAIFSCRDYLFSNVVWRKESRSDEGSASLVLCLLDHYQLGDLGQAT